MLNENILNSGTISSLGDTFLLSNITLPKSNEAANTYTIYLWVDDELSNNSFLNSTYSGSINLVTKLLGGE